MAFIIYVYYVFFWQEEKNTQISAISDKFNYVSVLRISGTKINTINVRIHATYFTSVVDDSNVNISKH